MSTEASTLENEYNRAREEERSFWIVIPVLLTVTLGFAGAAFTVKAQAPPRFFWLFAAIIPFFVFAFYVREATIGVFRRQYLNALEQALWLESKKATIFIDTDETTSVPVPSYSKITWQFSSTDTGPMASRGLFSLLNLIAVGGTLTLTGFIIFRQYVGLGNFIACGLYLLCFLVVALSAAPLVSKKSRDAVWMKVQHHG